MSSFREVYTDEVEQLFGQVKQSTFNEKAADSAAAVPQEGQLAPLVPFAFNGSDVFDENDTMDVLIYIPDEMVKIVKVRAVLAFREFFAPATAASSGGGSTSGSGGGATSGSGGGTTSASGGDHYHATGTLTGGGGPYAAREYLTGGSGAPASPGIRVDSEGSGTIWSSQAGGHTHTVGAHTHTTSAHAHTTPAHTHDLTYGVFKETMPGSHSVSMNIYQWDGAAWASVTAITGLTADVEDVDLSAYITAPGKYRLAIYSPLGSPNGGRLGCDVAGHIVGAIQPR